MATFDEIDRLARSGDPADRRKALRDVEQSHDLRVVAVLSRLVEADDDPSVRLRAEAALRVMRTRIERALDQIKNTRVGGERPSMPVPRPGGFELRKKLGASDARDRRDAVLEILRHRERHRVDELLQALETEKEGWVRAEIADALGQLGRAETAGDALTRLLDDPVSRVRANAVEALGRLQPPGFQDRLRPRLMDSDRRVRANAAVALKNHMTPEVEDCLDSLVESRDPLDLKAALWALRTIGGTRSIARLELLLDSAPTEIRDDARRALEHLRR